MKAAPTGKRPSPIPWEAVIFDLDGVVTDTASVHAAVGLTLSPQRGSDTPNQSYPISGNQASRDDSFSLNGRFP